MTEPDVVAGLEARARAAVDAGSASHHLTTALDQLVADRTNGEPLDVATALLRTALAREHLDEAQ